MRRLSVVTVLWSLCLLGGCGGAQGEGSSTQGESSGTYPSDKQVIADLKPKKEDPGFISVEVTKAGKGEAYQKNLQWYYDRGAIVRRKADIAGAGDVILLVGGLARYQLMGDTYKFATFLTTYNEYEGLPRPKEKDLVAFVKANLNKVFQSREHNIYAIEDVRLVDGPWTWHNPNSFSVPFTLRYKERKNNTTIEERQANFDIRFYRNDLKADVHALMATEGDREILGQENYEMAAIDSMPNLRTGLK